MIIFLFLITLNPFYDGNFTSRCQSATAVFENPSGLGYNPILEEMIAFHRDSIVNSLCLKGVGLGVIKRDSSWTAEAGLGFKLPGAFSLGYAFQFPIKGNLNKTHSLGVGCRPNNELALGLKTTLAKIKLLHGGASIMPVGDHLVLSADCEYEGTTGMFRYYLGCMIRRGEYINVNFHADDEFNWTVGLGLGYSRFRVAAVYTRDRKFGIGLMVTENQP